MDLIPSPLTSVKIQIMGGKVCLRCKGKTLLGIVKKYCILGGDNFRAFRVDLGGQNSKGDNFQLYHTNKDSPRTHYKKKCKADTDKEKLI